MKTAGRRGWLLGAFVTSVVLAAPAAAQFPGCEVNVNEVEIVEPLNVQLIRTTTPNFGVQVLMAMNPVPCGLSPAGCYEFGVLPVTYSDGPTSPTVLEVGSSSDPIEGAVQVVIQPLLSTNPEVLAARIADPPSGTWDGSSSAPMNVDITFDPSLGTVIRRAAKVQIPVDFVQSNALLASLSNTAGVVGVLEALHTPPAGGEQACGLFNIVKRNLAGNQFVAKALDASPTPILFLRQAGTSSTEVIVVEALNTQFLGIESPFEFGVQTVMVANPVKRPETICGNPTGSPTNLIDCYELAMVYVSYDPTGKQILHLPKFPDPAVPLDIQAPITGTIEADILPIHPQTVTTLFQGARGEWDGQSTNSRQVFLYTLREGRIEMGTTYTLPTIRIPAGQVQALIPSIEGLPGGVLALVQARHEEGAKLEFGFFSSLKRNVIFNQDLGNLFDGLAMPVIFTKNPDSRDDREVILVEPLNLQLFAVPGFGMNLPVAKCVTVSGTEFFEFGVTYVTYDIAQVQVHEVGGTFPITGDLRVSIAASPGGMPISGSWSASGFPTGRLMADTSPDQNLGVRFFTAAKVRILKEDLVAALPPISSNLVAGTLLGAHEEATEAASGFYNSVKRNLVHTQAVGNTLDGVPTPLLFQTDGACTP